MAGFMRDRLQKIIAASGHCSRRSAEQLIAQGRVTVNNTVAVLGDRCNPELDVVKIDGKPIADAEKLVYIMLNKPRGYLSTLSDDRGRKTVAQLVSDVRERVYPVGRLDYDSEGLLLMTNDGAIAKKLTHPQHEIKKTYKVVVTGKNITQGVERLSGEFELDGYKLKPTEIWLDSEKPDRSVLLVTIGEGRNRQIRRMCEIAKLDVLRLQRISEGKLKLGGLKSGDWRYLSDKEITYLKSI